MPKQPGIRVNPFRFKAREPRAGSGSPQTSGQPSPTSAYAPPSPYPDPLQTPAYQATYGASVPTKKPGKWILMGALVLVGFAAIIGGTAFAYLRLQATPDSVFKDAVANALSTRQVKQNMDAQTQGNQELQYDFSNGSDPRVYAHANFPLFQIPIDVEQYASLKNSYIKINGAGDVLDSNPALSSFKGKWMQTRKDDQQVGDTQASLSVSSLLPEPETYMFGDWIFGNFSPKDRQDLQNYIIGQNVFSYSAKNVVKKRMGNQDVYVYDVTEDAAKKTEMNKRVAAIWGVNPSEIESELSSMPSTSKATLYVSIKTKQLIEVDSEDSGIKVVNTYSDYNNLSVPSEPTVQADYMSFLQQSEASVPTSASVPSGSVQ